MSIRLLHGDCLIELPKLAAGGERFHAVVTDPPYGLEFMGREWDGANGFRRSLNEADAGRDSVFGRTSQHGPEYRTGANWQTGAGFSKPGIGERETPWPAFTGGNDQFGGANPTCATCGGRARGKKKCACAEPDWRVKGAAPDKMYGRHRQMRTYQDWCEAWARALYECLLPGAYLFAFGGTRTYHRMVCAIEDAGFEIRDQFAWLYGCGFPKSHDVSKAIDKSKGATRTESLGKSNRHGGGIAGNGTSYELPPDVPELYAPATPEAAAWQGWGTAVKPALEPIVLARKPLDGTVAHNVLTHGCGGLNIDGCRTDLGRFPANVLHDGSPDVLGAFAEFGTTKSSGHVRVNNTALGRMNDDAWQPTRTLCAGVNDSGSAARFFYSAKADAGDRADSKHPTVKPVDLIRWLVTLACPPGGHVLDCFAGSGTTGEACMLAGFDCTLIEREAQHAKDIEHRIKRWSGLDAPLFADAP